MNLDDLRNSVSSLSDEQLAQLISDIRRTRRTSSTPGTKRKAPTAKPSQDISMNILLSSLDPSAIDALINQLENKKG